jgi:membrane protease subunit HflK
VPDARGRAAQIFQAAEGYKQQAIQEAKGQSARFLKIYEEYAKAKDVTRERIYLETMERVLGGSEKFVYDSSSTGGRGILPYLPLGELTPRRQPGGTTGSLPQSSGGTK